MSRRVAQATSRFLARRSPRRGFLSKTAVVGSALVVTPKDFITRPGTAYAQVCDCGGSSCDCDSLCCDGYTELCCTIFGTNGCPPGSLYGGWWRVSGSNFCGGANRYYLDCHSKCGGCGCGAGGICSGTCNGTPCGCALGSCKNRKAGCTHFRYGQCNQHLKCVGPIICRAISCTPPWQLEPNCTTSLRTDEATRHHHRACLNDAGAEPLGSLDVVANRPGAIRVRGWAIDPDVLDPVDVLIQVNGRTVTAVRADEPRPDVGAAYGTYGENHGFDITFPSTIGTREVCAFAVNNGGGPNTLLGCELVKVSGTGVTGIIEAAEAGQGRVQVSGWAMVEGSSAAVDVDLYVNDEHSLRVTANLGRADLVSTLGSAGSSHGFAAELAVNSATNTVCATATDPDTGETRSIGCTTVQVAGSAPPHGALDAVSVADGVLRVTGWALDPDGGDASVSVLVDGSEVARLAADQGRPDVAVVHPSAERTGGFSVMVPLSAPGDHNVCVYSYSSDGGAGPLLGCADATVPQ